MPDAAFVELADRVFRIGEKPATEPGIAFWLTIRLESGPRLTPADHRAIARAFRRELAACGDVHQAAAAAVRGLEDLARG